MSEREKKSCFSGAFKCMFPYLRKGQEKDGDYSYRRLCDESSSSIAWTPPPTRAQTSTPISSSENLTKSSSTSFAQVREKSTQTYREKSSNPSTSANTKKNYSF